MAPDTEPVKVTADALVPLHTVWLATAATVGVGFTTMVKLAGVPVQPPADGVTVTVDVPAPLVTKDAMLPEPDVARPVAVLEFVQV